MPAAESWSCENAVEWYIMLYRTKDGGEISDVFEL